jgi:hypothetical protein
VVLANESNITESRLSESFSLGSSNVSRATKILRLHAAHSWPRQQRLDVVEVVDRSFDSPAWSFCSVLSPFLENLRELGRSSGLQVFIRLRFPRPFSIIKYLLKQHVASNTQTCQLDIHKLCFLLVFPATKLHV